MTTTDRFKEWVRMQLINSMTQDKQAAQELSSQKLPQSMIDLVLIGVSERTKIPVKQLSLLWEGVVINHRYIYRLNEFLDTTQAYDKKG